MYPRLDGRAAQENRRSEMGHAKSWTRPIKDEVKTKQPVHTGNGDYCHELDGDTLTIYVLNKPFFTFDLRGQWLREIADW